IADKDVPQLLARGRLAYPRKLIDEHAQQIRGYITIDKKGTIGILTSEEKSHQDALAKCPKCSGSIHEKKPCFSCCDCDFVIWKKIAGKTISTSLAQILVSKGQTRVLKGFRSKAGKSFSAALKLENNKVVFDFSNSSPKW
ncbi:MAG: topoisomerase C-terminal repeat-containing protein, partial [Chlamydiota bacterium]